MMSRNKVKELNEFIEDNKHLPPQGSEQWLRDRKFTIGGSEMSTITGDNPYKNIKSLISEHIGLRIFRGNINTVWGSILEDLVILILERVWRVKIYETGSLTGIVPGQKYSPDGLFYHLVRDLLVLLEIKCPIRRNVDGKVPKHYMPQILTGLESIAITDVAVFVDAMFRRCSLEVHDMNNSEYDFEIHSSYSYYPDCFELPKALYMLVVYEECPKPTPTIDLGSCGKKELEEILFRVKDGKYKKEFIREFKQIQIIEKNKIDPIIFGYCGINIIGVMPLKLFKFKHITVEKSPGYVHNYVNEISNTIDTIRKLDPLPPKQQKKELNKLFPRKSRVKK